MVSVPGGYHGGARVAKCPVGGPKLKSWGNLLGSLAVIRSRLGRWGTGELVVVLRWLALGVSAVSVGLDKGGPRPNDLVGAGALGAVALVRTLWPLRVAADKARLPVEAKRFAGEPRRPAVAWGQVVAMAAELAVAAAVVAASGASTSPFLVSLAAACFAAGLVLPPVLLGAAAVAVISGFAASGAVGAEAKPAAAKVVEGVAVVASLALLGSYSEWLRRKAQDATESEVSHLKDMVDVNQLLLELHAKAASQPAMLSLKAAVSGLASRLCQLLQPDVVVLLLASSPGGPHPGRWEVTLAVGVELPSEVDEGALAPALSEAQRSLGPVCRSSLGCGEGLAQGSWTGLYVPLWARDRLVGLLAVERAGPGGAFGRRDLEMVEGLSRHAGLAIDNARWFRRLRALGAEEERARLARELHDRVGQSLAALALCLERLQFAAASKASLPAGELSDELGELAREARRSAHEVRMKLCDLRTEVVSEHGLAAAVEGLLQRTEARSGMTATLCLGELAPLSPATAREVVRIAEEALNNAERHSGATRLEVSLSWDGRTGTLVVADDGRGVPAKAPLRPDAFGILGMRERAESIGGELEIGSTAGKGTSVVLRWGERARRK